MKTNIGKIIGYICVAAVAIAVVVVTEYAFIALIIALGGFWIISKDD